MPKPRVGTGHKPTAGRGRPGRPRRAEGPAEHDGRERILAAAIREFSEVGYTGATTAGIARAAGVTQPLIHHYFGSKEGLWRAAVDTIFANMPSARVESTSPREALMQVLELFVRFVAAHPEATRVIAREGAAPSPRLDYLVKRYLHEPFRNLVDLLRAAQGIGILAPEIRPEVVLFLFLGAGSHLFDVSALARSSQGIDTTAAWTREAMVVAMRTLMERGLFQR